MSQLYSFHPAADEQQTEIWLYTHKNWGAEQADKYIDGLHEQLSKVAQDFSLLRNVPVQAIKDIKFFHYGRHYVFVREAAIHLAEKIQVLTLLHDSMDIPIRLREMLELMH